ncbi:hypothetical protein LC085_11150 [Bacillus tianshenii]|uniref:hypothetical protein n=1 Tax=Sutcliffiella tianshenii TaxID=1463404 RepID=UPI001CD336DE|nr:hypothetical protein [Bacillus tianshenii]MCA1320467.1 hypothetical protein [Bacillus tianshenii]
MNRIVPLMKHRFSNVARIPKQWDWSKAELVLNANWLRTLILACLCPVLMIIPAYAFELAMDTSSAFGYLLAILLLLPWLIIPTLFIQHITSHSKVGKIVSYVMIGLLFLTFIFWINAISI